VPSLARGGELRSDPHALLVTAFDQPKVPARPTDHPAGSPVESIVFFLVYRTSIAHHRAPPIALLSVKHMEAELPA
jgi:hypothetical protein